MPRSLWNGTISVGAINVPIKLYSAVQSKTVHFHEVHLEDGARIEHRRFCSAEDEQVPHDEIVKGFEVSSGQWVVLEPDEVKAAAGRRPKVIDVDEFVDVAALDPVFFERTYFVGAQQKGGADAYRLLHDALAATGRAAVGRFVFHNREYLTAILPFDGILALHTLRFADEVVAGSQVELEDVQRRPGAREVKMAVQLVEGLHEEFDPAAYEDEYRRQVLALIDAKAAGKPIEIPDDEPHRDADGDLAAILEASLGAARGKSRERERT